MLNFNQLVCVVFTSTDSRSIVICSLFTRKNKSKCKEMPLLVLTPFYFCSSQIIRIIYIITWKDFSRLSGVWWLAFFLPFRPLPSLCSCARFLALPDWLVRQATLATSAPVSILHSRGAVTWPESTCSCSKASVSFSETLFVYKEWKYSCGVLCCGMSSMCDVFSGGGASALCSAVSSAWMFFLFFCHRPLGCPWSCCFTLGRERHTAF